VAKSGQALSRQFLVGCGLPDGLITYLPSLLESSPIQFHHCFISYASTDLAFAERLYTDLQMNGIRCWFGPQHMEGGKKIHEQIDEAIHVYERLLVLLSNESMRSPWVQEEIAIARAREEAEGRPILFPIALTSFSDVRAWRQFDSDLGEDIAKRIREYFIPDFSNWKTDDNAYRREFERLLSTLRNDALKKF
jgi:hypothetical protein